MAETQSNLNMEAIETFAGDSVTEMRSNSAEHIATGNTKWGTLKSWHDDRFSGLDGKEVELNE